MVQAAGLRLAWPSFTLGTVQFGYPYGLSRTSVPQNDVGRTLARAWECGVDMLDTAPVYGNSEALIGAAMPASASFEITTKTMALRLPEITATDVERVVRRARQSAADLRVRRLEAILVHEAEDLLSPGSDLLMAGLRGLCAEGFVGRVGVSVYDPDTLDTILSRHKVDIVQLPLNVFDQRFTQDDYLKRLVRQGIEIHTRSVFLQGLLLQSADRVPAQFAAAAGTVARFHDYVASLSLSPVDGAILFAGSQEGVSRLVIGIDGVASLEADIEAMAKASTFSQRADFSAFAIDDPKIIDPRRWTL